MQQSRHILQCVVCIRELCDIDKSGKLNSEEFALAMHMISNAVVLCWFAGVGERWGLLCVWVS